MSVTKIEIAATAPVAERVPQGCPRRAKGRNVSEVAIKQWIILSDLWHEPFRLFFPVAIVAGICGVMVWPFVFWGWMEQSPVLIHTRLMALGFFGGFVVGFLGTSAPRLLGASPLSAVETSAMALLHLFGCAAYLSGSITVGDGLIVSCFVVLLASLVTRFFRRSELFPATFLMVLPAFLCAFLGIALSAYLRRQEGAVELDLLSRQLLYHGFVLLCLLGAGGFLLPRFLGTGIRRPSSDHEGSPRRWKRSAVVVLLTGFGIAASYGLDLIDRNAIGAGVRVALVVGYLVWEIPVERIRLSIRGVDWILILGLISIPVGILASGLDQPHRIAFSHIEMACGFGLVTLGIASRVVLGHSGNRHLLKRFHPGCTIAALFMVFGAASRIVGELIPELMMNHYIYGAICWAGGGILWGASVLINIARPDSEG